MHRQEKWGVYGLAKITAYNLEKITEKTAGYIHVWKLEEKGWKIVLEVLSE